MKTMMPGFCNQLPVQRTYQLKHHVHNFASSTNTIYAQQLSQTQPTMKRSRPRLLLAPMETLGDRQFRLAQATVRGADEAVHEFIRITDYNPESLRGVLRRYDPHELSPVPLVAQIMGSNPDALAAATTHLVQDRGAPRVDLNCGCPAKRVNGRGAGAALLLEPDLLYRCAAAMVGAAAGRVPVSVKIRAGYHDTAMFEDVVAAAQAAGVSMLTIHPRTKKQAYRGDADWSLIARAKRLVGSSLEVVGNGDVCSPEDALRILDQTGCDHVMVGRAAVANPWVFWEIRAALVERGLADQASLVDRVLRCFETERAFFDTYLHSAGEITDRTRPRFHSFKIGRIKMLLGSCTSISDLDRERLLRLDGGGDARVFTDMVLDAIESFYHARETQLVSMRGSFTDGRVAQRAVT